MKKLLLFISFVTLGIAGANAQCTPDPLAVDPGIYPDSATGLSSGCEGQLYEQVITVVVPQDTVVAIIPGFPQTVVYDSVVLVDFQGLPASGNLTYACNTTLGGCSFEGNQTGCMMISGTPTAADVGTHNLTITVDAYLGGFPTSLSTQVIDWYYIDILDASTCASAGIVESENSLLTLFPNPAEDMLKVEGIVIGSTVEVYALNGELMQAINDVMSTEVEMDVNALESGIYFVKISGADQNEVIRFMKK